MSFLYRPTHVALSLLLFTGACGDGGTGSAIAADEDRLLDWDMQERYAVGGFDAPDWATFGEIGDLGFDGDGNLYIFDDQVFEITVVSPTGEMLRKFGRRGEGPGEIGQPLAMAVFPDGRVAISDLGKRGIALFDSTGEWLGNVPLDMTAEGLPGPDMMAHPDGGLISAEGLRLFMNTSEDEDPPAPEAAETRPVYLYPTDEGEDAFELYGAWDPPDPPSEDDTTLEAGGDGNRIALRMSGLQAFEPGLHAAVLRDGRIAVVDSTDYRVQLFDAAGSRVGEWSRPVAPTTVTERIREVEMDRRLADLEGDGPGRVRLLGGGGGGISFDQAQFQEAMRGRIEQMSFYPEIPTIMGLGADGAGRLWVERPGDLPGEDGLVDILSPDGAYLGSVTGGEIGIPEAFGPGGLIAVVETDEFDVATVRVLEVPTGGG